MTQVEPHTPQKLQKKLQNSSNQREYYAAMALQALITKDDDPLTAALLNRPEKFDLSKLEWYAQLKAKAAVIYADALLAELDQ